ncbi:putative sensor/response regulator hybrid [Candidatus Burkholderia verschuerenii]|uniref:Sensory/regulatory protein RpfC n=1 Tax=Candidatus Burkholderia verschuerenii TaxID=242163 RepID=A0A0L0MHD3_9BURK|nr:putative sensor/response regulator hybrid [Candidatus Burkholderia verschuerenii]
MTGVNYDITAQYELESALREAKEQADAASAAKSSFLANMSHEIRTPMNAVLGMLHLVQLTTLNRRQQDYVSKAETAAKSLLNLLNDILDYSKIEAGKLQLDSHPFQPENLMEELGVVLSGNQGTKDVEVLFDLDPELPRTLIGDGFRLQQVLINLAGNALKFTSAGQVVVSMHLLHGADDQVQVRVAVSDSGIGISETQLQRIFEDFTQAEASTTRRFGGSGLGLVICKRLVTMMGGCLDVESRVNEGSRFWFDIPLGVQHDAVEPRDADDLLARPVRILIADDNLMAGEILSRTVRSLGWQADLVTCGIDAVERIGDAMRGETPYDIARLDWRMPDLDGLNAAKLINTMRGYAEPPRVLLVTAFGREVLQETQDSGVAPFVGFLTKPVTPKQLMSAIRTAMSRDVHAPAEALAPRHAKSRRLRGLDVLVVEDNALNRQVAEGLLRAEGAKVTLAESGREGIEAVLMGDTRFDVVLMDVQMPDLDGLEATRLIRADGRFDTLPIVAMTANASNADRDTCLDAGMNDHVGKPIDVERLVAVLRQQVGLDTVQDEPADAASQSQDDDTLTEPYDSIVTRFGGNVDLIRSSLDGFGAQTEKQLTRLAALLAAGPRCFRRGLRAARRERHGGHRGRNRAGQACQQARTRSARYRRHRPHARVRRGKRAAHAAAAGGQRRASDECVRARKARIARARLCRADRRRRLARPASCDRHAARLIEPASDCVVRESIAAYAGHASRRLRTLPRTRSGAGFPACVRHRAGTAGASLIMEALLQSWLLHANRRPKLLIADDQPVNIRVLYELFRHECDVFMATTGAQAVQIAQAESPDLILLDVVMDDLDGHEVCRRLKADPLTSDVPVIFITAQDREDDEVQALELGAVDFLSKPINPVIARAGAHASDAQAARRHAACQCAARRPDRRRESPQVRRRPVCRLAALRARRRVARALAGRCRLLQALQRSIRPSGRRRVPQVDCEGARASLALPLRQGRVLWRRRIRVPFAEYRFVGRAVDRATHGRSGARARDRTSAVRRRSARDDFGRRGGPARGRRRRLAHRSAQGRRPGAIRSETRWTRAHCLRAVRVDRMTR